MLMEFTFQGPKNHEVHVLVGEDGKAVQVYGRPSDLPDKLKGTGWVAGKSPLFVYATNPDVVTRFLVAFWKPAGSDLNDFDPLCDCP